MELQAERAMMSRTTLSKIEEGDPGVSIGHYASVLKAMGMLDKLTEMADIRNDPMGLRADADKLPLRVRNKNEP